MSTDSLDPFAGGDQDYLRTEQYGNGRKLDSRARLHLEFGTASHTMASFEASLITWPQDASVLECGAGTGLFWRSGVPPTSISVTITDLSVGMVARQRTPSRRRLRPLVPAWRTR